jgi:hypothetical protein
MLSVKSDTSVAATFFVRAVRGELGPWNAVRELGGTVYLVPGCLSRDSALRHLLGALQADPLLRNYSPRILPSGEGYVVYLHVPDNAGVGAEVKDPASAGLRARRGTGSVQPR